MEQIIIGMEILIVLLLIALIIAVKKSSGKGHNSGADTAIYDAMAKSQRAVGQLQSEKMEEIRKSVVESQAATSNVLKLSLEQLENRFNTLEKTNEQKLENIRNTMEQRLSHIQADNSDKLENMRQTVDEKLQKTLDSKMTESFKLVNERLQAVYVGLGEMKNLAVGVGDLKKVLSNVKTRGIVGEIQLGAILGEILSPEQYDKNIATIPKSKNVVEFAIKLPGDDSPIYLPIDSKFPMDAYEKLLDAYDDGSNDVINAAVRELSVRIKQFAKDIYEKYIEPPYTTDFGIMFLPFEGLYSEVINRGLVNELQRDYHVNIAGPSTLAAFLNSIQMGFKTLAIKQRTSEVWKTLGAVKTEFDKFSFILEKTQKNLDTINSDLNVLIGTRTNVIKRKLRDVEKLDESKVSEYLGN